MKFIYSALLLIILTNISYSQNASTFFPSTPGYKWHYKNTPLDSLNNPQPALTTYQIDSFSTIENYKGLLSSTVLSKTGLTSINQNAPFLDTNHYNFQSTNGFYYLNLLNYIELIPFLDSATVVTFLRSFEAWYNVYRFGQAVNTNYTIFTRDTTLTVDTLVLPLRLAMTGRRLNDQNISTINGNLPAKKFLLTFILSYGVLPPFIYLPIITRPDTTYISEGRWIIKEVLPSTNVDLTGLGFPVAFSIPGNVKELTNGPTGIYNQTGFTPGSFNLSQNYPNPFNPVTKINFSIPNSSIVKLAVYNSLGKEISTLVNERLGAGSYEVNFSGGNLSSGLYYYKLESEDFSEVKKMILIK
ncbi:MAG: T9SS type A sorting domain-containing protein [Bacteroidota bacterium]|nr:T9SS type A sorting domain-containing protein [Bacteroidota bacterium]